MVEGVSHCFLLGMIKERDKSKERGEQRIHSACLRSRLCMQTLPAQAQPAFINLEIHVLTRMFDLDFQLKQMHLFFFSQEKLRKEKKDLS